MVNAKIVPAEERHVGQLIRKGLRSADALEAIRVGVASEYDAVADSFHLSTDRYAVLVDDECIALFGVCPDNLLADTGMIWMLTSPDVEKYWMRFARMSKRTAALLFERWGHLYNWVDAENEDTIRWLEWVGFNVSDVSAPYGLHGNLFCYFEKRRDA